MAYSELIKNFNKVRDYIREFYVFGFKSRDEFTKKSARSYDDERRRIESWLGDYMKFRQSQDGKNVFLSIDSRSTRHNPLYNAWKAKSFTDGDITLHFILFDILSSSEISLSLSEITDQIDNYLKSFSNPKMFDESTIRKKLKEYVSDGLIETEKQGKTVFYRRADAMQLCNQDILDFFSEVSPCGVIGSYLLDKADKSNDYFSFKHHYITSTLDNEILLSLFQAMHEKRQVMVKTLNRRRNRMFENHVIPLRVMISVQSGRQNLMVYWPRTDRITSFRLDNIVTVKKGEICNRFDEYREMLSQMMPHIWGVSTQSLYGKRMEHVEFTVKYAKYEQYIHSRLEREKRCGTVEKLDDGRSKFSADVFDASEMIPWIRTFICRITEYSFSNKELEDQFRNDIQAMYKLYGIEEVNEHDF